MTLKLTYFDFPGGRGEASRIALHLSGADWTDDRFSGNWPEKKATTPFGGLPVLEVPDHGVLSECNAILSYVGRRFGLLPAEPFEAARHEAVMSAVEGLRAEVATTAKPDADETRAAREAFATGYFTRWATNMSAQITGPFVGGETLSVADLKLYVALLAYTRGVYDHVPTDILGAFPKLTGLIDAVAAHPGGAEWNARTR